MQKTKPFVLASWMLLAPFALAVAMPSHAQEFLIFEGKEVIREGDGGSKKIVNGMDFWVDGAPPKPFMLIGYITDRRHKTGLFGMFSMSSLETSVVEVAKKNGGDAVIQISSEAETIGIASNATGNTRATATAYGNTATATGTSFSSGYAAPVQKQQSKYAVVRYVTKPDSAAPAQAVKPQEAASAPTQPAQ